MDAEAMRRLLILENRMQLADRSLDDFETRVVAADQGARLAIAAGSNLYRGTGGAPPPFDPADVVSPVLTLAVRARQSISFFDVVCVFDFTSSSTSGTVTTWNFQPNTTWTSAGRRIAIANTGSPPPFPWSFNSGLNVVSVQYDTATQAWRYNHAIIESAFNDPLYPANPRYYNAGTTYQAAKDPAINRIDITTENAADRYLTRFQWNGVAYLPTSLDMSATSAFVLDNVLPVQTLPAITPFLGVYSGYMTW